MKYINKYGKLNVILSGKDVTKNIQSETIGNIASQIASLPRVRKALLNYQRTFCVAPGLIADGRDMGTIVFPNAVVKIFLDAKPSIRTKRRLQQLQKKNINVNFKHLVSDMTQRDTRDRKRIVAPLIPGINALIIDASYLSINEVKTKVLNHIKQVLL